jgi:hypothetical protein
VPPTGPTPTPHLIAYRQAVLADKPLVFLQMNETAGPVLHDVSGNGWNSRPESATPLTAAGSGAPGPVAWQFDGSTSQVDIPYVQTNATAYTIEVWIKTTANVDQPIVNDIGQGPNPSGASLSLGVTANGMVSFAADAPFVWIGVIATSAPVNDGKWHHIAATWAAPSGAIGPWQFALYVDGFSVATMPHSENFIAAPLTGSGPTTVGRDDRYHHRFNGAIEEIAIYTKALPADRILKHFEAATI